MFSNGVEVELFDLRLFVKAAGDLDNNMWDEIGRHLGISGPYGTKKGELNEELDIQVGKEIKDHEVEDKEDAMMEDALLEKKYTR
ncbi:hypothetical protein R6Q57_008606 [Mikania cordata]